MGTRPWKTRPCERFVPELQTKLLIRNPVSKLVHNDLHWALKARKNIKIGIGRFTRMSEHNNKAMVGQKNISYT